MKVWDILILPHYVLFIWGSVTPAGMATLAEMHPTPQTLKNVTTISANHSTLFINTTLADATTFSYLKNLTSMDTLLLLFDLGAKLRSCWGETLALFAPISADIKQHVEDAIGNKTNMLNASITRMMDTKVETLNNTLQIKLETLNNTLETLNNTLQIKLDTLNNTLETLNNTLQIKLDTLNNTLQIKLDNINSTVAENGKNIKEILDILKKAYPTDITPDVPPTTTASTPLALPDATNRNFINYVLQPKGTNIIDNAIHKEEE